MIKQSKINPTYRNSDKTYQLLALYIISLFLFVHDAQLIIISEILFILFIMITLYRKVNLNLPLFNTLNIVAFLFLFFTMLSILWSENQEFALQRYITIFQLIILMLAVSLSLDTTEKINKIINSFTVGGISLTIISIYHYGVTGIFNALNSGDRLGAEIIQANIFGYYLTITALVIFANIILGKGNLPFNIMLLIVPVIFIVGSGSRRSLIILVFGLFISLILKSMSEKNLLKTLNKVVTSIIILISFSYIFWKFVNELPFLQRFTGLINFFTKSGEVDNSILIRNQMMNFGFENFLDKPILGYGLEQFRVYYYLNFGAYRPAHNGYIQILFELGIIGFLLYYGFILFLIVKQTKIFILDKNNNAFYMVILLSTLLISDVGTSSIYEKFTYVFIGISFAILTENHKEKRRDANNEF